jgi:hypothetical protein
LVVRFRRARGTEHQQLRWVALAGVAVGSDVLIIWGTGVSFAVLLAGGYAVVVLGRPSAAASASRSTWTP